MEHKEKETLHHGTSESGVRRTPRRFHRNNTQYMVTLALLSALVIVLQLWGSAIPIGTTSLSLVLIPIVIGGLVLGVRAGAFLGLLFGAFVFVFCGVLGNDPFTAFLFAQQPVMTALICIVKGGVAGLMPPLVHRMLCHRFSRGSVMLAAAVAPVCNTGIFLLGMLIIMSTLRAYLAEAMTVGYFIGAIILINFAVEFAVNLIVSPAIYRIVHAVTRQRAR